MPESDPRIAEGIIFKTVGEEMVLLDLDRGVYYGLNEIGARVWELMSQGATLPSIIDLLAAEYDVDRDKLRLDVTALMDELQEKGLVTRQAKA